MAQGEEHSIPWPGEKNRVSESRRKPSQLELALGCGVKREGGTMRMCGEPSQGIISGPMTLLVSLLVHLPCSHRQWPVPILTLEPHMDSGQRSKPSETQEGVSMDSSGLTGPWQWLNSHT